MLDFIFLMYVFEHCYVSHVDICISCVTECHLLFTTFLVVSQDIRIFHVCDKVNVHRKGEEERKVYIRYMW